MRKYKAAYFSDLRESSLSSARAVVPHVMRLVGPRSVADVGCGIGTWLSVFVENGVTDVLGVDGDYLPREQLTIPQDRFRVADLAHPLDPGRTFDLAMSLEVAEHVPAESAEGFVESLVRLAPVVMFSAAVPLQGGRGHVNEQWPTFWAQLFSSRGFVAVDAVRPQIWDDDGVAWWYRQNILIYVRADDLAGYPQLAAWRERTCDRMLSVVHPKLLNKRNRKPLRPVPPAVEVWAWVRAGRRALLRL